MNYKIIISTNVKIITNSIYRSELLLIKQIITILSIGSNSQLFWFCTTVLSNWVKKKSLNLIIQSEVKPKPIATRSHTFSRASGQLRFEFWLVHWNVCVLCDWPEWLLWFWFHDTQLKTTVT